MTDEATTAPEAIETTAPEPISDSAPEPAPDSAPEAIPAISDEFHALIAKLETWEHDLKEAVKADLEAIVARIKAAL